MLLLISSRCKGRLLVRKCANHPPSAKWQTFCYHTRSVRRHLHSDVVDHSNLKEAEANNARSSIVRSVLSSYKHPSRSPSSLLAKTLQDAGHTAAVPLKFQGRVDHSYLSPQALERRKAQQESYDFGSFDEPENLSKFCDEAHEASSEIRLSSILSRYIQASSTGQDEELGSHNVGEQALVQFFDQGWLEALERRSYSIEDVVTWAWIVTARSSKQAAVRLLEISNRCPSDERRVIPTFVFLFILRRPNIPASALKLFLMHAWDRLRNQHNPAWATTEKNFAATENFESLLKSDKVLDVEAPAAKYPVMDELSIILIVIRLLRHARRQWAPGIPSIVSILTEYVRGPTPDAGSSSLSSHDHKTTARLTFLYNKLLALLAVPSSQNPFQSIPYHQRAQFNILRRMNSFEPPLVINRQGYQAITRIQLAHRKTLKERNWAALKSSSWPPWKEDKLGLDVEKGVELGVSRANETLSRLHESGFASGEWENAATILTGWDTDRSPTIQTRRLFPHSPGPRFVTSLNSNGNSNTGQSSTVWTARVMATRTLDEAWACFLAYREQCPVPIPDVYFAMMEKLVFYERSASVANVHSPSGGNNITSNYQLLPTDNSKDVHAGDGLEVSLPPTDPRDRIYVKTSPPDSHDFYQTMISDGIVPSSRFLSFLIAHATSLEAGLDYLQLSNLSTNVVRMLLGLEIFDRDTLRKVPGYLFTAYVKLLVRSGSLTHRSRNIPTTLYNPILHARRLVFGSKTHYRPAWTALLSGAARRSNVFADAAHNSCDVDIASWHATMSVVGKMRSCDITVDFAAFHIICSTFARAAWASRLILIEMGASLPDSGETKSPVTAAPTSNVVIVSEREKEAKYVLENGLSRVKKMFRALVAVDVGAGIPDEEDTMTFRIPLKRDAAFASSTLLPHLLEVPAPAHIHVLVRALGLSNDYDALRDLVRWMVHFAPELQAVSGELANGHRMMRCSLTAVRAFLEARYVPTSGHHEVGTSGSRAAPEELIEEVAELVESVEDWGGWPTDDEVEQYCQHSDLAE